MTTHLEVITVTAQVLLTPDVVIPNDFIPDYTGDFRELFDPNYLIKLTNYLIAEGIITTLCQPT